MTLTNITKKQQSILTLLPQFRFLDRTHIQSLLHHKDKQLINTWLKDLTEKQYITRIYDNSIIGKNRVPAVYYLGQNGIRFLKEQGIGNKENLNKLYYDKSRSESFINHCLFIATVCCQLRQKNSEQIVYDYSTESDLSNSENPFYFLKESGLSVDLCFCKKQEGKDTQYYLLKLFVETLPKYRIQKQIRDLKEFYFSNEWENNMQTSFPIILLVSPIKQHLISTKRYTKRLLEENQNPEDLRMHVTIIDEVKEFGINGNIWEKTR